MQDISEAKLVNLIRNSMVLISSSYMEGFNYTILEAIAEGLPTLVSDIDVHREIYDNSSLIDKISLNQRQYSDKNVYNNIDQVLKNIIDEKN